MRRLLLAAAISLWPVIGNAAVLCYGEVSAGKTVTGSRLDDPAGTVTIQADGLSGGIGMGCDLVLDRVVIGALARYDLQDVSTAFAASRIDADAMWSAAARAGVLINPGTLVYGLAGIAGTEISYAGLLNVETRGLLYGAGLEIDLGVQNLALFAEWNHIAFGKQTDGASTLRPDSDVFRVGIKVKLQVLK